MSVYQPGDIVEFVNYENVSEFGLIISVQISDTISALVVSGFQSNKPQWISTDQVKGQWRNVKDYVSMWDYLKEPPTDGDKIRSMSNAELAKFTVELDGWTPPIESEVKDA